MIPLRLLLRLQRNGVVAMSYLGIAYALINSAAFPALAGRTPAAQRAFGAQVEALGQQLQWLLPRPVHPETAAGYLQWRGYGFFAIAFAVWAAKKFAGGPSENRARSSHQTAIRSPKWGDASNRSTCFS